MKMLSEQSYLILITILTYLTTRSKGYFIRICESDRENISFGCENLNDNIILYEYDSVFIILADNYNCEAITDKKLRVEANLIQKECLKSTEKGLCSLDYSFYKSLFKPEVSIDSTLFNNIPVRIEFEYYCGLFTGSTNVTTPRTSTTSRNFTLSRVSAAHSNTTSNTTSITRTTVPSSTFFSTNYSTNTGVSLDNRLNTFTISTFYFCIFYLDLFK